MSSGTCRSRREGKDLRARTTWSTPTVRAALHEDPNRGGTTSIRLASEPELAGVTGRFYANGKPKRSSKRSYDLQTATPLWQVSNELVRH